jgi:hypothetical protein
MFANVKARGNRLRIADFRFSQSPIPACPFKIEFFVQIHTKKSYCEIGQNFDMVIMMHHIV